MSQAGLARVSTGVLPPVVPIRFTANDATIAVPALGNLNVFGAVVAAGTNPFASTASGSTLTFDIQKSQAIASADATKIGLSNFNSSQFTVDANGFVSLSGTGAGQTITGDSGGALSPTAGNWNILGQQSGTIAVMDTVGTAPSTLRVEDRTWLTSLVVDPSATVGLRGTFQTIAAAITAASAGQTIFIREGTYTENLTLKDGVNLVGFGPDNSSVGNIVLIVGNMTASAVTCSLKNLNFKNVSGSAILTHSSASGTYVYFNECSFLVTGAAGSVGFNLTGSGGIVDLFSCSAYYDHPLFTITSTDSLNFHNFTDIGGVQGAVSTSSGVLRIYNSLFFNGITTSGTGVFEAYNSTFGQFGGTGPTYTFGNIHVSNQCCNCNFLNTINNPVTISAGVTMPMINCTISTSNTNAIAGAGQVNYAGLSFSGASSLISTTTQVPKVRSNDAVKITTPGAYPYTTIPQDAVILVDTSSARTIVPLASPTTGQVHRIKDSVGSAAANNITITPSGKNIDGAASYVINNAYGSVDIVYNGTEWNKF